DEAGGEGFVVRGGEGLGLLAVEGEHQLRAEAGVAHEQALRPARADVAVALADAERRPLHEGECGTAAQRHAFAGKVPPTHPALACLTGRMCRGAGCSHSSPAMSSMWMGKRPSRMSAKNARWSSTMRLAEKNFSAADRHAPRSTSATLVSAVASESSSLRKKPVTPSSMISGAAPWGEA